MSTHDFESAYKLAFNMFLGMENTLIWASLITWIKLCRHASVFHRAMILVKCTYMTRLASSYTWVYLPALPLYDMHLVCLVLCKPGVPICLFLPSTDKTIKGIIFSPNSFGQLVWHGTLCWCDPEINYTDLCLCHPNQLLFVVHSGAT